MLDRLFALETQGIKLGLDNITHLCAALDHPERAFTSLHIAGTNGKGSVAAMVDAALVAARVRTARYTSPHLTDLAERFVIDGAEVDRRELETVANRVLDRAEQLRTNGVLAGPPTFFEATTAIAFELFRRAGVRVAVIEVGLGGRFDSTNVVAPPVGAITSIGFDHQQLLGDTLEAIAFEKAGIIKPGMTIVTGRLPPDAERIVARVAAERQARHLSAGDGTVVEYEMQDGRATLRLQTPADRYHDVTLALRGEHQVGNAVVAVRVLEEARAAAVPVDRDAIVRGLTEVEWPARLELIRLGGGGEVLLDAAHNADGADVLRRYLARWHPSPPVLVIGVMRDKDVEAIVDRLLPAVSSVIATAAPTLRAMPAAELAARIRPRVPDMDVTAEEDPLVAVERALTRGRTVCVAGSIFLAGAVREPLKRRAILR